MKFKSLRSKLIISVSALVIGSGAIISILETHRFSKHLHEADLKQGEYIARALALEATDKILTNDLAALQNLLKHLLNSNPSVAYLFVDKKGEILAHTFSEGIPFNLIGVNVPVGGEYGNFKRIANEKGEKFLDIAWPIFSGKAGVLRVGMSEKPSRSKINSMWLQMAALTLTILIFALAACFVFIKRITRPLAALAGAAEKIDERNLELAIDTAGPDEVGRLSSSINRMLNRIKEYMQKIEQDAEELDRAHRQTKNAFEIIREIWEQDNLKDVSAYLIGKFQGIVSCRELLFLVFSKDNEKLFIYSDGTLKTYEKDEFENAMPAMDEMEGVTFVKKAAFGAHLMPNSFRSANRIATFPVVYENQRLGAMLIPCPGDCQCVFKELDVISLILSHSAGAIKRAVSHEEELQGIQSCMGVTKEYCGIVGKDPKMEAIYKLIEDIAPTDTNVLVQGESGTGKELVAHAIHQKSLRGNKPFVVINCAAYTSTLLESELFGHEKGAFTGAIRKKAGRFEQAHQGTVFLDEVGEISMSAQIKLLRVLQTRKFERVGGEKTLAVDVRILAATNKDLLHEVKNSRFREDLYYRLNVITIQLPPLKERQNDIPVLSRCFVQRIAAEQEKETGDISSEAMRLLLDHSWPGNVRELENCIEHAVVLARGARIEASDLPATLLHTTAPDARAAANGTIRENEVQLLKKALEESNWNKKLAARRLGISRNTLYRKIRKYRISPPTVH
jgi:DNA-binding NtrC family response regulator/HAMP domain-containing protein